MKLAFPILVLLLALPSTSGGEVPRELERLNEQRSRKIAEIDRIYKQQLETLKAKYTKAGDLNAANQVVAILRGFESDDPPTMAGDWEWRGLGELILQPNGVAKFRFWKGNGQWSEEKPGVIRVTSDSGRIFEFTVKNGVGRGLHPLNGKSVTIEKKNDK
ncbi:hypothetical protein N8513_01250 [bacterium]|nr:hypothetical protein [bacterium]MDA8959805.1 hypothetical protein [Akkermansiaceae bacterium]MDB4262369.1 hypothetical protein [bacterium]MDB4265561.1 hypothetical protein [Akkermansiaceae bacterium]MDB4288843.1 hypothetical protein [bacterium]